MHHNLIPVPVASNHDMRRQPYAIEAICSCQSTITNQKNNIMKIAIIAIAALVSLAAACGNLKSVTTIKPNDSFVLGDNEHGSFKVRVKNISAKAIDVYRAPIAGGKHSRQTINPNQTVTVKVERNTALVFENANSDTANVQLKVTGDIGLSMNYKNQ
jgi:hypothetical protein